jgi:osmotically-inducible protein OsmY
MDCMRSGLLSGIVATAALAIGCAPSDARITASVKGRLTADDVVKARRIDVDTRERIVTLIGSVGSSAEEARELQIARDTEGVTGVVDKLTVEPEPDPTATTGSDRQNALSRVVLT